MGLLRSGGLRNFLSVELLLVLAALAAAAALAWAWLLSAPMLAMDPDPVSIEYLGPASLMWAVMMVAMMVPSATPMVLLRARIDKAPSPAARTVHTALFVSAYLLVWGAFSAVAAIAQALLVRAGFVGAMGLSLNSRAAAGAVLLLAALYEMTAAKRLCLDKCQSPLLFILRHFTPGPAGAFRLGFAHGLFCLGCCWALMLLLFVGGVMNLAWVAALGLIVVAEKLVPPRLGIHRYVAAVLGAAGIALLLI